MARRSGRFSRPLVTRASGGKREIADRADRIAHVDPFRLAQRHVQDQRERLVRLDLPLAWIPDLELGLLDVGLDRQQSGGLDLLARKRSLLIVYRRVIPAR